MQLINGLPAKNDGWPLKPPTRFNMPKQVDHFGEKVRGKKP